MASRAPDPRSLWPVRFEWISAALLAAAALVLHVVNMRYAGGLWRDEAATVYLAQMPSFSQIWSHLEHESFPLLVTMLLRGWSALGLGDSDRTLRAFGLLFGIAVIAALWWNAWRSSSPPLLSMLLFALSPTVIRWGDSLRGYGLGIFFILLSIGSIWSVVRLPSMRTALLAAVAGVFAVQTLYQNAFVLASICLSGAVVALRRQDYKRALLVFSIGIPAALSLLPYLPVVKRANEWNVATQIPLDLPRIGTVLQRALSEPNALMLWFGGGILSLAIVIGVLSISRRQQPSPGVQDADLAWFCLVLMLTTTVSYYIFLKIAKFPTETWYYLVWMAVMAVAADALLARAMRTRWSRAAFISGPRRRERAAAWSLAASTRAHDEPRSRRGKPQLAGPAAGLGAASSLVLRRHVPPLLPWRCRVDHAAAAERLRIAKARSFQRADATRRSDSARARET